jgi:predicted nucleic acid-binding protein
MSAVVADTHALIWYITADPRLSAPALAALQQAEQQRLPIYVPTIVVIELRYLVEKKTITEQEFDTILGTLKSPTRYPTPAPLDLITAESLARIPRAVVPEMPDRIVAATAWTLGLPLVTRDTEIRKLTNITIIW